MHFKQVNSDKERQTLHVMKKNKRRRRERKVLMAYGGMGISESTLCTCRKMTIRYNHLHTIDIYQ